MLLKQKIYIYDESQIYCFSKKPLPLPSSSAEASSLFTYSDFGDFNERFKKYTTVIDPHYCISGVDFTNILRLRKPNFSKTRENKKFGKFCLTQGLNEDPKSAKRHWWLDCLFALLGSAHKTLVKLTPDFLKVNLNDKLTLLVHCLY